MKQKLFKGIETTSESFKTVMKNIRDGGTTNQNVMNFYLIQLKLKKKHMKRQFQWIITEYGLF